MADYLYLDSTGVIIPQTSQILTEVAAEYTTTFGADLVITPDSPAGVLISAETLARTEVVQNNAAVANQLNPNIAAGTFLDAIMALTGVQRSPAAQTYVSAVTLNGIVGTIIPAGTIAATAAGDQFATVVTVTIGGGGSATVDFRSVALGPIPCAAHALNVVVTAILGWETVDNPQAGILGFATQSDVSARAYRTNTLGFQGVALPVAITSALYNIEGITSVWFQENVAATTQVINGISMVSHSIYVVVNGGNAVEVAAALLENKSSGCAWVGGTSQAVVEPASGQTYTVKWDYATPISISFNIETPNGNSNDIKNAILAYMAGTVPNFPLVSGSSWALGGTISAFEVAAAIVAQYPAYIITNCEISLSSFINYDTIPITMEVNQQAFTTVGNITVTVT